MIFKATPMRASGRVGLVVLPLFLLTANACFAESASASPQVPATSFVNLLQVMFGLGIVLAAIAGTAWLLKRLGPGQTAAASNLRVVGGVAIGPKERVVLVDVGDTRLVLGVAPGHVSTLYQMPRPADEVIAPVLDPMASLFQDKLKTLLNKSRGGKDVV